MYIAYTHLTSQVHIVIHIAFQRLPKLSLSIELNMTVEVITLASKAPANFVPIKSPSRTKKVLKHLRPHTHISSDFDDLKFNAAASLQLQWSPGEQQSILSAGTDTRLIASPYNDAPHLLDIESLDTQSRLLALALSFFKPVRDDYATGEYLESFNWNEVFDLVKTFAEAEGHTWTRQSFYVVSFRSKLQPDVDQDHLHALDAYSHQEAITSGGLLKYWFGTKNEEMQNLATCEFFSRSSAMCLVSC